MRLFVAIRLAPGLRQQLAAAQAALRPAGGDVKWVEAENLHLTLAFLGETAPAKLAAIRASLEDCAGSAPPFRLAVAGVGAFPGWQRPRVLWAGVRREERLERLQASVAAAMARLGFTCEERFSGHLTLGRVRSLAGIGPLMARFGEYRGTSWGEQAVADFALMESQLAPSGPSYRAVALFTLTGKGEEKRA